MGVCVLPRGLEPACCSVDGQQEQMPDHPTVVGGNSDFGKKTLFLIRVQEAQGTGPDSSFCVPGTWTRFRRRSHGCSEAETPSKESTRPVSLQVVANFKANKINLLVLIFRWNAENYFKA